ASAGCYAPAPSCTEGPSVRLLYYAQADLQLRGDGAFALDKEIFPSCAELCGRERDVERVRSCTAPALVPMTQYADAEFDRWLVRCEVDEVKCHDPAIIPAPSFGSGRRPEGYVPVGRARGAGAWLAAAAALEAASVAAFERLAHELVAHRAPAR